MQKQTTIETKATIINGKRDEVEITKTHELELFLSEDRIHGQIVWEFTDDYYHGDEMETISFILDATNRIDEITEGADAFDELEAIPELQAWLREQGLRMPSDKVLCVKCGSENLEPSSQFCIHCRPVGEIITGEPEPIQSSGEGVTVRENAEKGGVEVKFSAKPDPAVLDGLKRHGFRWSKFQKIWYAKANDRTRSYANGLIDSDPPASSGAAFTPDYFDIQVEDNMAMACGV